MPLYINTQRAIYAEIFELTDTVWDDVRIPGLAVRLGSSAPDFISFLAAGGLKAYGFDGAGAVTEEVHFTVQIPHTYKQRTDLYPHIHWAPVNANAGNVKWQLEYSWSNIDGTFGASTTINVIDAADGTAWKHQVGYFSAIAKGGVDETISNMLNCRLFRDPADGQDTYGSDAAFLEFDFHFEVDTLGSRTELVKRP